ncbi:ARM repeat-containing protein [Aspergillus indologenus CBS 114.80]|uniref:ARM repeat-containing protein n=1 Tax=Aspergillus indologenus CBS 114.80 TaxID=1450541 RepID=A0A2V5IB03_9EURO|nr:ARM repeat-containing protein [Aspergillus indologenus CBS 114.80]
MEAKALELVEIARNSYLSLDAKTGALVAYKSEIKQRNVPEAAVPPSFEAARIFISSPHGNIITPAFNMLSHLTRRLFIQRQPHLIANHSRNLQPLLLERLGDNRERVRAQAAQAFTELWPAASAEVEHYVLDTALVGRNPRAKEMALIWLSNMSRTHGLRFRQYVAKLVNCLEDADPAVRDAAKLTVVELFGAASGASARAKADLMNQLSIRSVRKTIVNAILTQIDLDPADLEPNRGPMHRADRITQRPHSSLEAHPRPMSRADGHKRPISRAEALQSRPPSRADGLSGAESSSQRPVSRAEGPKRPIIKADPLPQHSSEATPLTPNDGDSVEPLNVSSSREIEDIIRAMVPHFDGRESEENWAKREKNVMLLRRLVRGNAPVAHSNTLITALKSILDGIFKVVNSLRTTMATNGCLFMQDMATYCGPKIDPMMEIIMQNLIKLCAGMKKITAQNGKMTVETVIQHVSFTPRILQHVFGASQDKNAQLRLFSADWFKIILNKQAANKSSIEHGGGLELLEKAFKKGLTDANPAVRQAMRGTFWVFFGMWPNQGNDILSNLDPKSRSQLEKDPGNPNIASKSDNTSRKGVATGTSMKSRSALQEAIAAHKKAHLAPKPIQQQRPESAQSARSDTNVPELQRGQPAVRSVPVGSSVSSLSSAPMRPASKARRPELSRPDTADPYSVGSNASDASSDAHAHHTVPAASTAKAKARKLDIAKTRNAESRVKGGLQENIGGQSSGGLQVPIVPIEHDSPAEAQSESPLVTVVPMLTASEDSVQEGFPRPVESKSAQVTEHITGGPKPHGAQGQIPEHTSESFPDVPVSNPHSYHSDLAEGKPDRLLETERPQSDYHLEAEGRPDRRLETERPQPDYRLEGEGRPDGRPEDRTHHEEHQSEEKKVSDVPGRQAPLGTHFSTPVKGGEKKSLSIPTNIALAELSINESVHRDSKPAVPTLPSYRGRQSIGATDSTASSEYRRRKNDQIADRKRSISPRSRDPVKAREMLEKGIQKIRSKNMDILGYRKLQGLIEYHDSIFIHEGKYDEMLLVLLEELESPPDEKRQRLGRPLDLKTQVLLTIRFMLAHNKHFSSSYYPRAITALIAARNYYDSSSHIINGLNETAEEILIQCEPEGVIDAVTDLVSTEDPETGDRAVTMGFSVMTEILKGMNSNAIRLSCRLLEKVGSLAGKSLTARQPDVRRQATQLCVQLHTMADNDDHFWQVVGRPRENSRNLLTYYIARK